MEGSTVEGGEGKLGGAGGAGHTNRKTFSVEYHGDVAMADLKPTMQLVFTSITNKCLNEGDAELKKEDVSVLSGAGATKGGGAAVRIISRLRERRLGTGRSP